jgi:DNA-binding LacI/PurR family transcriptional regulator
LFEKVWDICNFISVLFEFSISGVYLMVLGVPMTTDRFVYEKVINALMDMIRSENYAPGDKLPGVRDLAGRFDCNIHTVRKAIAFLQEDGLIEQRGRQGSFVRRRTTHLIGRSRSRVQIVSTRRIGILLPTDNDEYTIKLLAKLEDYAAQKELQFELHAVNDCGEVETALQTMKRNCCRSAVFIGQDCRKTYLDFLSILKNDHLPVVIAQLLPGLEKFLHEPPEVYSWFDRNTVLFQIEYFKMLGYSHIAYFERDRSDLRRRSCYETIANRSGLKPDAFTASDFANGVTGALDRWEQYRGNLAVLCLDDLDAMQLIIGALKRGWKLPEDMAVMGVNNFVFSRHTDPGISTVSFPYTYLAERMLTRAMELSLGETEYGNFTLPPLEVIIRNSCGGKMRCTPEKLQEILDSLDVKAIFEDTASLA